MMNDKQKVIEDLLEAYAADSSLEFMRDAANMLQASQQEAEPEIPTNEALEELYENEHEGHIADFAAAVLEKWGGWQSGFLGYGGALNSPPQPAKPAAHDHAPDAGNMTSDKPERPAWLSGVLASEQGSPIRKKLLGMEADAPAEPTSWLDDVVASAEHTRRCYEQREKEAEKAAEVAKAAVPVGEVQPIIKTDWINPNNRKMVAFVDRDLPPGTKLYTEPRATAARHAQSIKAVADDLENNLLLMDQRYADDPTFPQVGFEMMMEYVGDLRLRARVMGDMAAVKEASNPVDSEGGHHD